MAHKKRQVQGTVRSNRAIHAMRPLAKSRVLPSEPAPVGLRNADSDRHQRRRRAEATVAIPPDPPSRARERYRNDLAGWLRHYRRDRFARPFSACQLEIIHELQDAVFNSGDRAIAAPRGGAKTSIAEGCLEWVVVNGHRHFPVVIGATGADAERILDNVKSDMETNDKLHADYPWITLPIRHLDGSTTRARTQLVRLPDGTVQRSMLRWSPRAIRLATTGHATDGTCLAARGIDGAIRGLNIDGVRPDFVLFDDLETRKSIKSPDQTDGRRRRVDTDCAGLAGQRAALTLVILGTIMSEGSLMDEYTDRERRPAWRGSRYRHLLTMPTRADLWVEYVRLRKSLADGEGKRAAVAYYRENREAMDAGAECFWPDGYSKARGQISAVQAYYDALADRGSEYCACELQNDPASLRTAAADAVTEALIVRRVSGRARGEIPGEATILTAFCDLGKDRLHWAVCAWREDFTGWVIDYGRTPESEAQTLSGLYPGRQIEAVLFEALESHWNGISGRPWYREDGVELRLTRGANDARWEPGAVYRWHKKTRFDNIVPYFGMHTSAVRRFGSMGARARGCRQGFGWQFGPTMTGEGKMPVFESDVNLWKTFVMRRLLVPVPSPGCLVLFGIEGAEHREFARHLTAEVSSVETRGSAVVTKWTQIPGRPNHWLDCVVGCAALAGSVGAKLADQDPAAVAAAKATAAPVPKAEAKPAPAKAGGWITGGARGRGWITGY